MDQTTFHARVRGEDGFGIVTNRENGNILPCCWNDCYQSARREHKVGVKEGEKVSIYFFCCDRHKALWLHSSKDLGNLPAGARGMIT